MSRAKVGATQQQCSSVPMTRQQSALHSYYAISLQRVSQLRLLIYPCYFLKVYRLINSNLLQQEVVKSQIHLPCTPAGGPLYRTNLIKLVLGEGGKKIHKCTTKCSITHNSQNLVTNYVNRKLLNNTKVSNNKKIQVLRIKDEINFSYIKRILNKQMYQWVVCDWKYRWTLECYTKWDDSRKDHKILVCSLKYVTNGPCTLMYARSQTERRLGSLICTSLEALTQARVPVYRYGPCERLTCRPRIKCESKQVNRLSPWKSNQI